MFVKAVSAVCKLKK